MPLQEHEITRALEIARGLAHAGVPLFLATPNPYAKAGYDFPAGWENSTPDPSVVDRWRPGMALCAVGGHVCDFLDVDPRNGGTASSEQLWQAGKWPNGYGQAATPSGGTHQIIQPLGVGKGEVVAGVDLQGGRPDGGGRGFVFIAPTVRASKVDGVARPYRWLQEPDLATLAAWRGEASGQHIAALLPVRKTKKPTATTDDDFYQAETHTTISADRTIIGKAQEVTQHIQTRGWSGFRDTLNGAAYTLGAYVGSGYMTEDEATEHLIAAIRLAGYEVWDENLHTIAVGIRDGARHPIAVVRPSSPLARTAESSGDFSDWLIDAADLDQLEDPEPLIAGWLFKDTTARLVGQSGSFKSFVALDMACCVALGREWHGRPVAQTPVLYVVGEGLPGYRKRRNAWCEHNGVDPEELRGKLLLTRGSVQIGGERWAQLAQWVADNKAGLVVMDTQAKVTVGYDENSNTDQATVFAYLDALRQTTGGTLMLLHHTGHANGEAAERGRGASAWRAAVDTELIITKTGDRKAILRNDRQKEAESGEQVGVEMRAVAGSLAVDVTTAAPLSPRSQWVVDQVAAGVRFESAKAITDALRDAGHSVRNDHKAALFQEYHDALSKAAGDSYDPNQAAAPVGTNPFM